MLSQSTTQRGTLLLDRLEETAQSIESTRVRLSNASTSDLFDLMDLVSDLRAEVDDCGRASVALHSATVRVPRGDVDPLLTILHGARLIVVDPESEALGAVHERVDIIDGVTEQLLAA